MAKKHGTAIAYDSDLLFELHPVGKKAEKTKEDEQAEHDAAALDVLSSDAAPVEPSPAEEDEDLSCGPTDSGITKLFTGIPHITKCFAFILVADDGDIDLGPPVEIEEPILVPGGTRYSQEAVERACKKLTARSLMRHSQLFSDESGMGSGNSYLPQVVTSVRTVLLFVKTCDEDENYILVPGYSLYGRDDAGVAKVNSVLAEKRKPGGKDPYGHKEKNLKEMYSRCAIPPLVSQIGGEPDTVGGEPVRRW